MCVYVNIYKPFFRSDGFGWISVSRPNPIKCCDEAEEDFEGMFEAWDKYLESGNEVTYPIIERLAKDFNILVGKWFLFVNTGGKVDHIWSLISTAIIENDNLACTSAKVSTCDESGRHVICIYNKNFTDKHQVMLSELAIRNMGIKAILRYKPDIYTYLDIYSGNKWKLKPYIMVSNYDIKQLKSIVEEVI